MLPPVPVFDKLQQDRHAERSEFLLKCISDAVAREILPLRSLLLCTSHTVESRILSIEKILLQATPSEETGEIAAQQSEDSPFPILKTVCSKISKHTVSNISEMIVFSVCCNRPCAKNVASPFVDEEAISPLESAWEIVVVLENPKEGF